MKLCDKHKAKYQESRILVWFSCGSSSAVAAKLAVQKYNDLTEVVYCDTGGEHESNLKFLRDVEAWIGKKITILKSSKYKDPFDVFEKTKYLVGVQGARCTIELKKKLRFEFQQPDDIHIFGYTFEEKKRADRFKQTNPELLTEWILIDKKITKEDTLALISKVGIELPLMYKLGYDHNNCIGCPKGGMGYWNKIRVDFPEYFKRMMKFERKLGRTCLRDYKNDNQALYLDELDPSRGNFETEPDINCGLGCWNTYTEIEQAGG